MQDFVGVGDADSTEQARIGERPFERVIGGLQRCGKGLRSSVQNLDSTPVQRAQTVFSGDGVERSAVLRSSGSC